MSALINKALNACRLRACVRLSSFLVNMVLIGWLSAVSLLQPAEAGSGNWLTLVSLTFDDGLTESPARSILANHGMHGTFYVNSDLIGAGGTYLTKAELDGLFADGNEIASHTIGHVNLATLSDAAQRTAICNDMQNLINWGYPVYSFAYPFSSTGPTSQSIIAAGCPGVGTFESARAVGGLKMPTQCLNCPWAETIPPRNKNYIASIPSISSTTTLADLQSYVTQAENNGGGWVPLVFHRICDGCSDLAVTTTTLDAFLAWLETRTSIGTHVRTVHQVMSGDYPEPPPPPPLGPNQVINPSLEIDANANNQADCWSRDGYGTNTAAWVRTNDAHAGSFGEKLTVTNYTSGDRKLLATMDAGQSAGGCAPNVVPGALYQISAWYKSSVPAVPVFFYLDASGVWKYWREAPQLGATSSWKNMTYYPGTVPSGAQAISFGIALQGTGTLTTDDYSMRRILDSQPPSDTTPPVISNFTPANGATVTWTTTLQATASDNVGLTRVDFLVNGSLVGSDTVAPYSVDWNTLSTPNGSASLSAIAYDAAGNSAGTPTVNVTVNNQTGNLLSNPSLEIDANNDNIADCWQRGGYGTNTYVWSRLSGAATAHSGNFAESVQVTSLTTGDRKLVQKQDLSACSPAATVGARYTLSGWYKSTIPTAVVAYYRNSAGVWQYWKTGPSAPASSNWALASYTTPALPAGATAISFGLYLNNIGTLVTDDYSMTVAP